MKKHGRRDLNHQPTVALYRATGCSVADCADLGAGLPDLFVGCAGITDPVEVKGPDGNLTPAQETFVASWRGSRVFVVRDENEILAHVADMRRRAKRM